MKTAFTAVFTVLVVLPLAQGRLAPFYRYWRGLGSDHFYTTNANEIGTTVPGTVGNHLYVSEGVQCLIYHNKVRGSCPLYRYYNGHVQDHFYTTNIAEIGTKTPGQRGRHGYVSEGIAGYCFPTPSRGTVPLYRYYKGIGADHFYTTNPHEIGTTTPNHVGKYGYKYEGVACYVIRTYYHE